jgi:hypothetical protein
MPFSARIGLRSTLARCCTVSSWSAIAIALCQTGEIVSLEGDRLPARLYALTNGLLKKSENSLKTDL